MTKEEALEIIKLLSALESWSFGVERLMPDYLRSQIDTSIEALSRVILDK